MPIKLFPHLRFLNSCSPIASFSAMKPGSLSKPSRAMPILSRVFSHKLKYRPFRFPLQPQAMKGQFGHRKLSTWSGRGGPRGKSGSGRESRVQKSLVDDEADLSDWVSGLRSDSYLKTKVYSDSDDNDDSDGGGFAEKSSSSRGTRERLDDGGRGQRGRGDGNGRGQRGRGDDNSKWQRSIGDDGGRGRSLREERTSREGGRLGSEARSDRRNVGPDRVQSFSKRGVKTGNEDRSDRRNMGSDRVQPFPRKGGRFEVGVKKRGMEEIDAGYSKDKIRSIGRGGMVKKGGRNEIGGKGLSLLSEDEDDEDDDDEDSGYKGFSGLIDSNEEDSEEEAASGDDDDDDDDDCTIEKETVPYSSSSLGKEVISQASSGGGVIGSYLSDTRFDQFSLSPLSLKGIKDAGYEKMTLVQEATFPLILKGKDVLAKAKTGTGKTVAFLLPSIEIVLKSALATRDQKLPPFLVLVVCPTRELASQAAAEANSLLKYHPTIGVQVIIGGTRLALEQKRMQVNPCQILVATPGRLKDHIENTAGFATRLMGVKVLVLDEADHLLDMGFRKDIERIISAIPKQRQTLLFSATVPEEVRHISHIALKRDHEFINTVKQGSEETHSQVQQMYLVAPLDKQFPLVYSMLRDHIAEDVNYKVLVFCTTAMVTRLVAELLGELHLNVREIHSRKPQSYRTRVSDEFRKSKGLILVTSDVSARGVDYPDVTLVIQIGLPSDRQQYIHRLGRTGRKGKEGKGVLLLAPWEEFFLSTVKDLPMKKAGAPLVDPETKKKVEKALSLVQMKNKEAAYQAWLGYYNSIKTVGGDKYRLVELANEFSRSMGLDNPPAVSKLVLGKMGLKNIPGLRSK
ncbi:unnamed protein product [Cuscuta epithymum]|uniref:ATP-dependent RNA helicase n=1 Tax=Cuscuta epithymum TaxID=186058 RepID=A0AAV0DPB8_9ASTE|nr:unnamed protein product [Cuscuta epithymum]